MNSVDQYAAEVARHLIHLGLSKREAIDVVQRREITVRKARIEKAKPAVVARKIFARRGRTGGMGPTSISQAVGCRYVPIEGFFFDDPADLPPLDRCVSPSFQKKGHAYGGGGDDYDEVSFQNADGITGRKAREHYERCCMGIFGRIVPMSEWQSVYSVKVDGGYQDARVRSVFVRSDTSFEVNFSLRTDVSGSGELTRSFSTEGELRIVHHDLYMLDGSSTAGSGRSNRGVGAAATKQSLLWYQKNGFDKVETYAAWVGRYVWATFGFDWDDFTSSYKKDALRRYIEKRPYLSNRGFFAGLRRKMPFEARSEADMAEIINGSAVYSWDVASLHMYLREDGQAFGRAGRVGRAGRADSVVWRDEDIESITDYFSERNFSTPERAIDALVHLFTSRRYDPAVQYTQAEALKLAQSFPIHMVAEGFWKIGVGAKATPSEVAEGSLIHVGKIFLMGVSEIERGRSRYVEIAGQIESGTEAWDGTLNLKTSSPSWKRAKLRLGL